LAFQVYVELPSRDLIAATEAWLAVPKPFIWTASADEILEKVRRVPVALGRITA